METNKIKLRVKNVEGEIVIFKVKNTTKLLKLMHAYCTRQNVKFAQGRFLFNDKILMHDDTPDKLCFEGDDQIDFHIE